MDNDPNEAIRVLVERWCDRREYGALARILPAWTGNNGLTDGWEMLRDSLKHAYAMCTNLPADERDALKRTYLFSAGREIVFSEFLAAIKLSSPEVGANSFLFDCGVTCGRHVLATS